MNHEFKVGDKFILVRSKDKDLNEKFLNNPWGKEFEITRMLTFSQTYGQLYECEGYNVSRIVMEIPEIYNSPLYQALE